MKKQYPVSAIDETSVAETGVSRPRAGVTLIELLVVSTILVLIAAISLPILQLVKQREKENRLEEILTYVRSSGIGVGTPRYANETYTKDGIEFSSDGYRNFMVRKIMAQVGVGTPVFTLASASYAIATGTYHGMIYPASPSAIIFSLGKSTTIPSGDDGSNITIKITQRFIRTIPPHPFEDWYPMAHWEFKVATDTTIWYASETWPVSAPGVSDIKSVGAGISLSGENTDTW